MKKMLFVVVGLFIIARSVDVSASFVVEEEVMFGQTGETTPTPAPVEPEIRVDNDNPVTIPESEKPSKPEEPVLESNGKEAEQKQAAQEQAAQEKQAAETEIEEIEVVETEVLETEVLETETEELVTEEMETEVWSTEEVVPIKSEPVEDKASFGMDKTMVLRVCRVFFGILCILAAVVLCIFFSFGRVRIYSISSNNAYFYIGTCRTARKSGILKIYVSQTTLRRGKTNKYKIVLGERLLHSKELCSVYLVFPGQKKVSTELQEEVEFTYQ